MSPPHSGITETWCTFCIQLSFRCRFASWIINLLYIMLSFSQFHQRQVEGFFYFILFMLWLHHAWVGWQVYFLFLLHSYLSAARVVCSLSCLCFTRCVLRVPGIVCMFNSSSSCINHTVFARLTLPLPLAAWSQRHSRKCDQAHHNSLWGFTVGLPVSHHCQSWNSTWCLHWLKNRRFMIFLCSFKAGVLPQSSSNKQTLHFCGLKWYRERAVWFLIS